MPTLSEFAFLLLALDGILSLWLEGSLFADIRSRLEVRRDSATTAELLLCRLCLSVWISTLLTLWWYLAAEHIGVVLRAAPILVFALVGAANLLRSLRVGKELR